MPLSVHQWRYGLYSCADKTYVESFALSALADTDDRPKCLSPVWKFRNNNSNLLIIVDCWPMGRGAGLGQDWLWSERAAKSHWTAVTCTVTQNKNKIKMLKAWFFLNAEWKCLGYPTILHKYREPLVWSDGSSMDGQAHNLKDEIMAGPGCPSQTFTHCHLRKRPKNNHHLWWAGRNLEFKTPQTKKKISKLPMRAHYTIRTLDKKCPELATRALWSQMMKCSPGEFEAIHSVLRLL